MPPNAQLSTPLVWGCTAALVIVDLVLILVINRVIRRDQFSFFRRQLVILAGIFFLLVWTSAMLWAWEWFYTYIFPAWLRYYLPPIFWIGYTLLACAMSWFSLKLRAKPAVTWCLLGGLEGLLSHLYAIYGLGAVSNPPIMHGVSQLSVLIFAVFEKMFYWSFILFVVWLLTMKFGTRSHNRHPNGYQLKG
jgi:hypothetical protein